MGRWTDRESDEQRLPDGMQRIGYDADTQRYTYRDADGSHWEGEEGSQYGQLHPAGARPQLSPGQVEAHNETLRAGNRQAWRYMLPFALIAIVFLLLLFRFLDSGSSTKVLTCLPNNHPYEVRKGDTCWAIAEKFGLDVEGLVKLNSGLECEKMWAGSKVCVPE
ncbi:uncharacterized protein BDZ99DRAFT_403892 [Mytilinidion resinicola]|uniref:LysM domain-containing protein n=1 Tax=Mytilinidion resinicola TaxID=574789 RepID=A0A6A6Z6M7_9PEZI|nr:uncharacterized protein BDZ99DRAFT_403892 [Mytilinidion resinicola]KAF2816762.1 hypothetical protein BDZ99DRAFT_403892 [Mytilinidion resinicola]